MEKFLWCQPNDISFPVPIHGIWDTCHLIFYKNLIPAALTRLISLIVSYVGQVVASSTTPVHILVSDIESK